MCVQKNESHGSVYFLIKLQIRIFILCFIISLIFPYISQATLIRGIEAFEEKNYDEAVRILYPLRRF